MTTPAVIGEPPRFKFKPKLAEPAGAAAPAAAEVGARLIGALPLPAPTLFPTTEAPVAPIAASPACGGARGSLPQFPVIAGPGRSRTNPAIPMPHIKLKGDVLPEPETPEELASNRNGQRRLGWLMVLAVVGGAGYFGWPYLKPHVARFLPPKAAQAVLTPSETLNKLAHAPAAAIDKAQEALTARRAGGQTRVDAAAVGEDAPEKPKATVATPAVSKPKPVAPPRPPTMAPVRPGLAASVQLEAGPDASPEFRTFVANAKVSGVFQGAPSRAMINGKLTRAGETVEPGLGIIFDGLDTEKKYLIFRDRSGAIISRRY
ncbi:MAG: hypothetical protein ABIQ12_13080 [Opitutaceae bacterium]